MAGHCTAKHLVMHRCQGPVRSGEIRFRGGCFVGAKARAVAWIEPVKMLHRKFFISGASERHPSSARWKRSRFVRPSHNCCADQRAAVVQRGEAGILDRLFRKQPLMNRQ